MENLNSQQLKKLYSDFVYYRDEECGGFAKIGVKEFYAKNSKKYENVALNQCDGCARELPVILGIHRDVPSGLPVMACAAGLYA